MKEKVSHLKIKLPKPKELEAKLIDDLPDYKIVYVAFSDIWKISNKDFKHSIWYYPYKESKVKTQKAKEYKEVLIINIALILGLFLIVYLNSIFNWLKDPIYFLFVYLILFPIARWVVMKSKPAYNQEFEKEHTKLLDYFAQFKTS